MRATATTEQTQIDHPRRPTEVLVGLLMVRQPSFLPSPSSLPRPPFPPRDATAAAPAHTAGIFAGLPARPGDLVDNLTRSGSFAFLSELFDTGRLFEFRDFRISRVMPKGEVV